MRQIEDLKFRLWHTKRKHWLAVGMTIVDLQKDASMSLELPLLTCESGVVVQQFTGLKDVNEVDIYEGDILGYPESFNDKSLFEIRWAKAYSGEQWCEFRIQNIKGNSVEDTEPNDYYGGISHDHKMVVGNIFEGVNK